MIVTITRAEHDALGFDVAAAVSAYQAARTAHADTIGEPAPTAHPLVAYLFDAGATLQIVDPAPPPLIQKTKLHKATMWRRCTDPEVEALRLALAQASPRLQMIFQDSTYLDINDPDYPALREGVLSALGNEQRADEVLEPEF